jgi:hypothetical protein
MADPLTDAYEREIQRRTAPLTKGQQISQGIADLLPPAGISPFQYYPMLAAEKMASGVTDYLESPSDLVEGVRSGAIKENDPRLAGVDLVDIFDDDPTLGLPDFVPDDYEAGEIFTFDPTGEGKSKSVSDAMDLQAEIDKLGTVGGRGEIVEGPTERADFLEKQRGLAAEEFRLKEKQLVDSQGGLNSMSVADSNAAKQDAAEQLFAASMEDFISGVRGKGPETNEVRTLKDYKDEFFRATGIKAPGKINAGAALMAAGTAMMNNQMGGKGFSGMMSVLGQASEAAMPELVKAREKVDLESRAAGKYALEMRNADQATARAAKEKAMERSDYFIVPKSNDVKGFLAGVGEGKGKLESLSKYELNALRNDPKFREQFDVLPGSMWGSIVSEAMKTPEAKEYYDTKAPRKIELFGEGAGDMFTIETWRALPQSGRENLLVGTGQDAYEGLSRAARDINKAKQQFITGMGLAEGVNIFRFGVDKLDSLASTLGFNMREGITPTQQLEFILDKLQAQNAPEILGEAGKTISDADRARVAQIVGDLRAGSTADEITYKLNQLFNDIIIKKEQSILGALSTLDRYSGRDIASRLQGGPLGEEEQAELEGYLASEQFSGVDR